MRYYYDCPIEATYMAKNFGVELTYANGNKLTNDDYILLLGNLLDPELSNYSSAPFYLENPNVLRAEVGDMAQYYVGHGSAHILNNMDLRMDWARDFFVIQRNGKSFIMPKQERPDRIIGDIDDRFYCTMSEPTPNKE